MTTFSSRKLSHLVNDLMDWGEQVDSERGPTIEVTNETLRMSSPLDRVCTEEWRKMNIGFAIVDALSHIVGDNRLAPLLQFVPGFSKYSSDGVTIDGAYGDRFHSGDQLNKVIDLLTSNLQTRRAVLTVYNGAIDLNGGGGLNTPCTLSLNFLVRDGKLHMTVMMRSNDVILGLTNDVFTFTMLHEYVAIKTMIPIGTYTHFATSLHLYKEDLAKYNVRPDGAWLQTMHGMPLDFDPGLVYADLCALSNTSFEEALAKDFRSNYEHSLYFAAASVYHRKNPKAHLMISEIYDPTLQRVANFWVEGAKK